MEIIDKVSLLNNNKTYTVLCQTIDIKTNEYILLVHDSSDNQKKIIGLFMREIHDYNESEEIKMRKLNTIQKREKLNIVSAVDDAGNGGANHKYVIQRDELVDSVALKHEVVNLCDIQFQDGARNTEGAIAGVTDQDLLEIVRDRLKCFQSGNFSSNENAQALNHIEEALMWLNRRVEDRIERNVLGQNLK